MLKNYYKNYTGYLHEGVAYLSSLFKKNTPAGKFFIFTIGRSGSNLLVSLLNSHPLIGCANELLGKPIISPKRYLKNCELLAKKNIYGFKLNTYHFRVQKILDPVSFVTELHQDGYKIISLKRLNLIRQIISHIYAVHRNEFHHDSAKGELKQVPMHIDLEYLQAELDKFNAFSDVEASVLRNVPYLPIYYEDDLSDSSDHQLTVNKVTDFLGIASSVVHTNLVKTTPKEWSSFIENYSEVEEFLVREGYGEHLEKQIIK